MKMKNILGAITRLYSYTCDVFEFVCLKDEESKKTSLEKVLVYEKIPCRISYFNTSSVNYVGKDVFNNKPRQYIKLFLQNDIAIKAGSSIKVFKDDDEVAEFKVSGKPYLYSNHQEIVFYTSEKFC